MSQATRNAYIRAILEKSKPMLDSFPFAASIGDPEQHDCPIVWVNSQFCELTGYSYEDVVGRNCRFLQGAKRTNTSNMKVSIVERKTFSLNILNFKKSGQEFNNALIIIPVILDNSYLFVASQYENQYINCNGADHKNNSIIDYNNKLEETRFILLKSWSILLKNYHKHGDI